MATLPSGKRAVNPPPYGGSTSAPADHRAGRCDLAVRSQPPAVEAAMAVLLGVRMRRERAADVPGCLEAMSAQGYAPFGNGVRRGSGGDGSRVRSGQGERITAPPRKAREVTTEKLPDTANGDPEGVNFPSPHFSPPLLKKGGLLWHKLFCGEQLSPIARRQPYDDRV
jgi:hypothetical protein